MGSRQLVEITANLIQDQIKANIAQALAEVRTDRGDAAVTTEVPKAYYLYGGVETYRTPAVLIVTESIDFQKDLGANHINSIIKVKVAVIVEDKNLYNLNVKAWRYQAALDKILDQVPIESSDNKVKIICIVRNATFSPEFMEKETTDPAMKSFQKEVLLDLDVREFEGF